MLAALGLILGGLLLAIFLIFWCAYGMIAFGPHSMNCPCDGCRRRRDRAQDRYEARFRPPPHAERLTQEEWERRWEEESEG